MNKDIQPNYVEVKFVCACGASFDGKTSKAGVKAGDVVREAAKQMQGGGGGQPFYATAGGKNPEGLEKAITAAEEMILAKLH